MRANTGSVAEEKLSPKHAARGEGRKIREESLSRTLRSLAKFPYSLIGVRAISVAIGRDRLENRLSRRQICGKVPRAAANLRLN